MNNLNERKVSKFVFWAPRALAIALIAFLALFSLDVFGTGLSFWQTVAALLLHNIPVFVLIGILVVSWKWEIVGGIVFILAGLAYWIKVKKEVYQEVFVE